MKRGYTTLEVSTTSTDYLIKRIQINVSEKGKLNRIVIESIFTNGMSHRAAWGNYESEYWDFNELNQEELIRILEKFALSNLEGFKDLYYTLKKNDPKIFPIINIVLNNIKEALNFK